MKYDITYGAELEVGDVFRGTPIPPELGKWAMTETDVVNVHGKWRGRAGDPLGIEPPWGGEVNTVPAHTPEEAGERVCKVLEHLHAQPGNRPSCVTWYGSHVHVRLPGLRDNLDDLKMFTDYVVNNQDEFLAATYMNGYKPPKWSPETRKVHTIPLDGNRKMQPWMRDNILLYADSPERFFDLHTRGKDATVRYRMFRYCVNIYNLKFMDTIEFRWFRGTIEPEYWREMPRFCERFCHEALGDQTPIGEWLHGFRYPPILPHDPELMRGWEQTRYDQSRFSHLPRRKLEEAR